MTRMTIDGHGISSGLAIATARVFPSQQSRFDKRLNIEAVDQRIERFQFAFQQTKIDVMKIRNYTEDQINVSQATIFDSYLLFLDDKDFVNIIVKGIERGHDPIEVINTFRLQARADLSKMNEYFKGRQSDVDDVLFRIVNHMLGETTFDLTEINDEIVIVLEELSPSIMAILHPRYVKGIIVKNGSRFSHATMLAESLGIPIIRIDNDEKEIINNEDIIIMDADEDIIILRPEADDLKAYEERRKKLQAREQELAGLKDQSTVTHDGVDIQLMMNVNVKNHIKILNSSGAEGIGLVRTELLFNTNQAIPSEEEQYNLYKSILKSTDQSVTIRIFDFGGDKWSILDGQVEANPFMGTRGIRYLFEHIDVLTTQLRALIRASKYGNLSILFPFVTTVDELKDLQRIIENIEHELEYDNIKLSEDTSIGVMIETPGAAMMTEKFSHHCDFLALGTNDLVQYMFAADRGNDNVSKYYDKTHPAVLKIIREAIKGADIAGKPVTVCGDIASDRLMIPLLIGLGVRTLSVEPQYILKMRAMIKEMSVTSLEKLVDQAILADSGEQVALLVNDYLRYL